MQWDSSEKIYCATVESECKDGHQQRKGSNKIVEKKWNCDICGTQINCRKDNLVRHYRNIHKTVYTGGRTAKAKHTCFDQNCNEVFFHQNKLVIHMRDKHDVNINNETFVFQSLNDFISWKEKEEAENFVYFSRRNSAKEYKLNTKRYYFHCQHDGSPSVHRKKSDVDYQPLFKRKRGHARFSNTCPAIMNVQEDLKSGKVEVSYIKWHSHDVSVDNVIFHPVPSSSKRIIISKLQNGVSVEQIFEEINNLSRENRSDINNKRLISTDIIEKLRSLHCADNVAPVISDRKNIQASDDLHKTIDKLSKETYCPIFVYKAVGMRATIHSSNNDCLLIDNNVFLLGIQTKEQNRYFNLFCNILFVEVSEYYTSDKLSITTIKVLNEKEEIIPVVHFVTNTQEFQIMITFFAELRLRCSVDWKCDVLMSDGNVDYVAFESVFGKHTQHVICKWHLHKIWGIKIQEENTEDVDEQRKIYFSLIALLEARNVSVFKIMCENFIKIFEKYFPKFTEYFITNYLNNVKIWASCYRYTNPYAFYDFVIYQNMFSRKIRGNKKANDYYETVEQLLLLLLKIEQKNYTKITYPTFENRSNIVIEHNNSLNITDECVKCVATVDQNVNDKNSKWIINDNDLSYEVEIELEICKIDFCVEKCLELSCFGLCCHLYKCTCRNKFKLCRHLHKVHSLRVAPLIGLYDPMTNIVEDTEKDVNIDNSSILGENICNMVEKKTVHEKLVVEGSLTESIKQKLTQLSHLVDSEQCSCDTLENVNMGLDQIINFIHGSNN